MSRQRWASSCFLSSLFVFVLGALLTSASRARLWGYGANFRSEGEGPRKRGAGLAKADLLCNPASSQDRQDESSHSTLSNTSEDLPSALSDLDVRLRRWRTRVPPPPPSSHMSRHVERFLADRTAHARLSAARFKLDRELDALHRNGQAPDGLDTPGAAIGMPPPHEADTFFPEPSTFLCRMLPDGFEVCEYENVCADVPSPILGEGLGYASQTDAVYFVGSDIVPSYAHPRTSGWPRQRDDIAATAPPECRALAVAASRGEPWPEAVGGSSDRRCLRWLRHFLRLYPLPDVSIPWRVAEPADEGFDSVFEDLPEALLLGDRKRLLPFSASLAAFVIPPNETLSVAHGGSFEGVVTWVDNLYLARDVLESHLWGWSSTVAAPVLAAHWANVSAHWDLPPMDNLLVYGTPAWKRPQLRWSGASPWYPESDGTDRWAMGYLRNALEFSSGGKPAWRGPELGRVAAAAKEAFPWIDVFVSALRSGDTNASGHVPLPVAIPYDMALLAHPPGVGTRMIFSIADLPLPPDLVGIGKSRDGDAFNVSRSSDGSTHGRTASLHTGRRRICGRRMVALGQKPLLVGGRAEGNAFRDFAFRQLNVSRPVARDSLPLLRALVVDRGAGIGNRGFANLPAMLGILGKYDISVEVVSDMELQRMPFAKQVGVFARCDLLVTAHGAGLSSAIAIPQRACVIEVYPRGMWCDIYLQMMRAQGLHVFPIYSTLLGPNVRFDYHLAHQGPVALSQECEANSLASNAHEHYCWIEYRKGSIVTPLAEFERAVLSSMALMGRKTLPHYSPIDMIETGETQPGGDAELHPWILCPPPQHVAPGGRMGIAPYRCIYGNGTWLEGLPT